MRCQTKRTCKIIRNYAYAPEPLCKFRTGTNALAPAELVEPTADTGMSGVAATPRGVPVTGSRVGCPADDVVCTSEARRGTACLAAAALAAGTTGLRSLFAFTAAAAAVVGLDGVGCQLSARRLTTAAAAATGGLPSSRGECGFCGKLPDGLLCSRATVGLLLGRVAGAAAAPTPRSAPAEDG